MPDSQQTSRWQTVEHNGFDALFQRVEFKGFDAVKHLIQALIELADTHNHHPDIRFGYNYCEIYWTTHSQGGITDLDRQMAKLTDEAIAGLE